MVLVLPNDVSPYVNKVEVIDLLSLNQYGGMVLVLPNDVSPYVNKVEVTDLLFLNQYALLLVGMYKK